MPELSFHFTDGETKAYSEGACPKPQSQEVAKGVLKPKLPDTRAQVITTTLHHLSVKEPEESSHRTWEKETLGLLRICQSEAPVLRAQLPENPAAAGHLAALLMAVLSPVSPLDELCQGCSGKMVNRSLYVSSLTKARLPHLPQSSLLFSPNLPHFGRLGPA